MRGDFLGIWTETWPEIWLPLVSEVSVPKDVFCELYRELSSTFQDKLTAEQLAEIIDDPDQSRERFESAIASELLGERELVAFLESVHELLDDFGGDALSNRYFNLLRNFIGKFNLRYDLRRPCTICPTLSGIFVTLLNSISVVTNQDAHLAMLLRDFEESVRDLKHGCTDSRIKTCLGKQLNLVEAIGASDPDIKGNTLGAICDELDSWPHVTVKESLKKLYGFASNYPGIRHAGSASSALRGVDMRDLVAMSILLAGFTPYLSSLIDAENVYWGQH